VPVIQGNEAVVTTTTFFVKLLRLVWARTLVELRAFISMVEDWDDNVLGRRSTMRLNWDDIVGGAEDAAVPKTRKMDRHFHFIRVCLPVYMRSLDPLLLSSIGYLEGVFTVICLFRSASITI